MCIRDSREQIEIDRLHRAQAHDHIDNMRDLLLLLLREARADKVAEVRHRVGEGDELPVDDHDPLRALVRPQAVLGPRVAVAQGRAVRRRLGVERGALVEHLWLVSRRQPKHHSVGTLQQAARMAKRALASTDLADDVRNRAKDILFRFEKSHQK